MWMDSVEALPLAVVSFVLGAILATWAVHYYWQRRWNREKGLLIPQILNLQDLASGVVHNLHSQIAQLRNHLVRLERALDQRRPWRDRLAVFERDLSDLTKTIDDVETLIGRESARLIIREVDDQDLEELAQGLVEELRPRAEEKRIDLRLEISAHGMSPLPVDMDRIHTALHNLLGNAIKYTPEGGRVTVRIQYQKRRLRITVVDTGIGLDSEALRRIGTPFYRGDQAQSMARGSGLGLVIVERIAYQHGGRLLIHSEGPDRGACFTIELPFPSAVRQSVGFLDRLVSSISHWSPS